jgi:hypothetical protein
MRQSLMSGCKLLTVVGTSAALAGCAGMQAAPDCPDLSGTYANLAEGSQERLTSLLLPDRSAASTARSVSLSLQGVPQRLAVTAGALHTVLEQDSDFTCDAQGLRLTGTNQRRINFGSFLTQDVETIHALSKDADGALQVRTSTREHSVLYGKAVTGPLRQGGVVRWRPISAATAR